MVKTITAAGDLYFCNPVALPRRVIAETNPTGE